MSLSDQNACRLLGVPVLIILIGGGVECAVEASHASSVASPNGSLAVEFRLDADGAPRYSIRLDGRPVLQESRLGLVREDADFSKGMRLVTESQSEPVEDRYEILTAKRRVNTYRANRKVFQLATAGGDKLDVIFQVSDDGVAFRYAFPESSAETHRLTEERSSFRFLPDTRAWLQPMAVAKSGWEQCNPSYEEYYKKEVPTGTPSPTGAGWVFPALFRSGDIWLLVSECGLGRNYCGGRLRSESPNGEYTIGYADPREGFPGGPVLPESTLPWQTPWRIVVVGSLKTIAESTLGIDLADPPAAYASAAVEPGKASWS
ncbi:MAG: glycoside hydrolase family 97 N-terminal domain-containing protein, partial [Pirellulales bacterium]